MVKNIPSGQNIPSSGQNIPNDQNIPSDSVCSHVLHWCVSLLLCRLKGGELFDYLIEKEYLSEKDAICYTTELLEGVQHLHQNSICHLDLKVIEYVCMYIRYIHTYVYTYSRTPLNDHLNKATTLEIRPLWFSPKYWLCECTQISSGNTTTSEFGNTTTDFPPKLKNNLTYTTTC